MCRHAAAIGPPLPLATILAAPHGMVHQSYAARELITGSVCADGFGIAWYDADVRPEPARYVRPLPIWSDAELEPLSTLVHARCMMAAVRNATIAGANTDANCAPFIDGRYTFSLNGYLDDFETWQDALLEWIGPQRARRIHGDTDGAWIFQCILALLDDADPEPAALAQAVKTAIVRLMELGARLGKQAYLNILMSDGNQLVATKAGTQPEQNSLYVAVDPDYAPGASIVASEPLDEGDWQAVDPNTLVLLGAGAPPIRMRMAA